MICMTIDDGKDDEKMRGVLLLMTMVVVPTDGWTDGQRENRKDGQTTKAFCQVRKKANT